MPGVLAVYTAADLAAYVPHKCMLDFKQRDGSPMKQPVRKPWPGTRCGSWAIPWRA